MTVCLSHGGPTIYQGTAPPESLVIATIAGAIVLQRDGATHAWREVRRGLNQFHVVGLAHDPRSNRLIAAMHNGGLAVSEDGGTSWQDRTDGIASRNVYSVAIAYRGEQTRLYAGTEPAHLYCSDDFGKTWRELQSLRAVPSVAKWTFPAPPHDAHVINVTVHPRDPDTLYACVEQGGLFKSTDGGRRWQELQGFNDDVHRVLILGSDPERLIMPTGYGFYSSDDGGHHWTDRSDRIRPVGYPDPLVIDPKRENVMFLAGGEADPFHWMQEKTAKAHVMRSRDGGHTWQKVHGGMPERFDASVEAMALHSGPGGCSVFLGTTAGDIWVTDDDGTSWVKIAGGLPPVSKTIHYMILGHDLSFDKVERPHA
jgi:photosystem II stability/assembly factor-like uncharacterized protein